MCFVMMNKLYGVSGMKPKKQLGFTGLRKTLSSCFNKIPEFRQKNKVSHSIHDALMSRFACMHKNLCFNFYLLTLIAFTFHQVYELTDKLYRSCRQHFGSKKHLWENVRANLRTFIFVSWEYLLAFTLDPEKYIPGELPAPS